MKSWSVVVPVKRLDRAKTRLAGAVPGVEHERLVLALVLDTVTAALATPDVARVVVVTDDAVAASAVRERGALVVADEPDAGLNPAVRHGARHAVTLSPGDGVAVLSCDLPALAPAELAAALDAARRHSSSFVADEQGTGTTLLAVREGSLEPAFGPESAAAHGRAGAVPLDGMWPTLRRDVDTGADLAAADRLGLGPHTAALLAEYGMYATVDRDRCTS